jgi:hypothetical protein
VSRNAPAPSGSNCACWTMPPPVIEAAGSLPTRELVTPANRSVGRKTRALRPTL